MHYKIRVPQVFDDPKEAYINTNKCVKIKNEFCDSHNSKLTLAISLKPNHIMVQISATAAPRSPIMATPSPIASGSSPNAAGSTPVVASPTPAVSTPTAAAPTPAGSTPVAAAPTPAGLTPVAAETISTTFVTVLTALVMLRAISITVEKVMNEFPNWRYHNKQTRNSM